jgi:monofunctional biosynthetic peptidoglycan transglycosylase
MAKFFNKLFFAIYLFTVVSVSMVVVYKFLPIPINLTMIQRLFEGEGLDKSWTSYNNISPNFFKALIGGEDARFMRHNGIDWRAVEAAQRYNERSKGEKKRGASTVTMQTAKNAFLWQGRNYIRKALEAYFTVLIEEIWGKKRILEVYANVVEMGPGIYGVEAASLAYFGKPANSISAKEASLIAAILPNPRRWSASKPTAYIQKRSSWIQGRMNSVAYPRK